MVDVCDSNKKYLESWIDSINGLNYKYNGFDKVIKISYDQLIKAIVDAGFGDGLSDNNFVVGNLIDTWEYTNIQDEMDYIDDVTFDDIEDYLSYKGELASYIRTCVPDKLKEFFYLNSNMIINAWAFYRSKHLFIKLISDSCEYMYIHADVLLNILIASSNNEHVVDEKEIINKVLNELTPHIQDAIKKL